MKFKLAAALFIAAVSTGAAFGDTISFATPTGTLGTSHIYGTAVTVTAYGYTVGTPNTLTDLFGKNDSASESGVGINGTLDNEINSNHFVQLDLNNISGAFTLSIGSTQSDEGFKACFSNTLGTLGSSCTAFSPNSDPYTTTSFNTSSGRYISIEADNTEDTDSDNVLVNGITYTPTRTTPPVPEPSSLLLLGTGILGAAGAIRRKLSA